MARQEQIIQGGDMSADITSGVVFTGGKEFSVQLISVGGVGETRVGTIFIDVSNNGVVFTELTINIPVVATVAVNTHYNVQIIAPWFRVRWAKAVGVMAGVLDGYYYRGDR